MFPRLLRSCCGRGRAPRGVLLAAAGALLLVLARLLPSPPPLTTTARFPHVAPHKLAHLLADFSTHLQLYPHIGEWMLEDESSNYTAWRYTVSYSCGARCSGRAAVLALADHHSASEREHEHERWHELRGEEVGAAGRHAAPRAHTVHVTHRSCAPLLPVLSWPLTCEEWETETHIVDDGAGGALMRERARAGCGGAGGAGGVRGALRLGCAGELRAARDRHLQRLRALLA